jgi:predicted 3-demethylubiquinone-9 3-methyltransferase (glyoxalase superfamily)
MGLKPKISPCLWFDGQAEDAANFYVSVFPNSRTLGVTRNGDSGPGPKGSALVVSFELDGQTFTGLNGGPHFKFSEATSFIIDCADQAEVDHYWAKLTEGGGEPGRCAWLKDKFGVTWQVVPRRLVELLQDPDAQKSGRVMQAMLKMSKIEIAALEDAYARG